MYEDGSCFLNPMDPKASKRDGARASPKPAKQIEVGWSAVPVSGEYMSIVGIQSTDCFRGEATG